MLAGKIVDAGEVSGIGQGVQIDDPAVFTAIQEIPDEVAADKPGAARNE
jgi:hypothetical protein